MQLETNKPVGEHAYNLAIGVIGEMGWQGKLAVTTINFYVDAFKHFNNMVNWINTAGERMFMNDIKFKITGGY